MLSNTRSSYLCKYQNDISFQYQCISSLMLQYINHKHQVSQLFYTFLLNLLILYSFSKVETSLNQTLIIQYEHTIPSYCKSQLTVFLGGYCALSQSLALAEMCHLQAVRYLVNAFTSTDITGHYVLIYPHIFHLLTSTNPNSEPNTSKKTLHISVPIQQVLTVI